MKIHFIKQLAFFLCISCCLLTFSCREDTQTSKPPKTKTTKPKIKSVVRPTFSGESAYNYVQKQVDFGPRYPGSQAQKECADWLKAEMEKFADEVMVQEAQVEIPPGKQVPMYNIISSFNPSAKKRVLLSAHWDTRPIADHDEDEAEQDKPILGANDGGSGIGVLLEMAQQLKAKPTQNIGVDIIFWDVEDSGRSNIRDSYCKGSQYWGRNPHKPNYTAVWGINLDMVGANGAVFPQDGHSRRYAPQLVKRVWAAASALGYSGNFIYEKVAGITDDHYYMNVLGNVPTIDIIQYDPKVFKNGFGDYWHTHDDDMDIIDKGTLQGVGETVLGVVYQEDEL